MAAATPESPRPSETEALPSVPAWETESETFPFDSTRNQNDEEAFLATDHERLDKWLSERFAIDYRHMEPEHIFEQVPLNDIYYEIVALPENAPKFKLESQDIRRRELLEEIGEFWDLEMLIVTDESGTPTAVHVLSPGFYR